MYEPAEQLIIDAATEEIKRSKIEGAQKLLPIGLPMAKLKNDRRSFHVDENTTITLLNHTIELFMDVYKMPGIRDVLERFGEDAIRVHAAGDPVDPEYVSLATGDSIYAYYQTNVNMVLHLKRTQLREICLSSSMIAKLVVENERNVAQVVEAYSSLIDADLSSRLRNMV